VTQVLLERLKVYWPAGPGAGQWHRIHRLGSEARPTDGRIGTTYCSVVFSLGEYYADKHPMKGAPSCQECVSKRKEYFAQNP